MKEGLVAETWRLDYSLPRWVVVGGLMIGRGVGLFTFYFYFFLL